MCVHGWTPCIIPSVLSNGLHEKGRKTSDGKEVEKSRFGAKSSRGGGFTRAFSSDAIISALSLVVAT